MLRELVALGGVVAWAVLLGAVTLLWRPDRLFTAGFLFGDEGVNLLVAETIAAGGVLYRDLAYPYGPLPAYLHAGAAWLFGNRVDTYLGFVAGFSLLHLTLLYFAVRRFHTAPFAAAVCVLGFVPTMHIPAALFGSYTTAAYIPVERCLLTALVLVYTAPASRSPGRALLLGLVLGAMQFTKFGGCYFAGGPWSPSTCWCSGQKGAAGPPTSAGPGSPW